MNCISQMSKQLKLDEYGIWVNSVNEMISYPEEGNQTYFDIEDNSFWFRHRNSVISFLVKKFSPDEVFFDIGGGNGCVSKAIQSIGIQTVLIEPGESGARNAKKRGIKTVIQSTFENANFFPESIQSAGLFDVLEHIQEDYDFLMKIHHFLKPKGTIYLSVPSFSFLWSEEDQIAGHFRRYTRASLFEVLNKAGFDVKYYSYFFSFLVLPVFIFRAIPSFLKLRTNSSKQLIQKEHSEGSGLSKALLQKILNLELRWIRNLKQIWLGSSLIVVATKR